MATHEIPTIHADARTTLGSRPTAKLRTTGQLPAVIYGHKQDPVHVSLNRGEITGLLHHNAHVIEVEVDSKKEPCLIKDVQWDHLGSELIHVDLARVDLTERVTVEIELELVGEAVGLKESGTILEHHLNQIEVKCLASDIPEQVRMDISELNVGQSLTVSDLVLPEGVEATQAADTLIAAIHVVTEAEETEEGEATPGAGEPEVIGKADKPDEGKE